MQEPEVINLDSNETVRFNEIIEEQVRFHRNWLRLREAAMEKEIQLYGDVPFFVSHDSADVWAAPHRFCLDTFGKPTHVSGTTDYFSKQGNDGARHYTIGKLTVTKHLLGGRTV